jgi:hypothetical protein
MMSTARVDFTRSAAERIARVVRLVEQGDRDGAALSFRKVDPESSVRVRLCGWTGAWGYLQTKVIQIGSAGHTATAINDFFGFRGTPPFVDPSTPGVGKGVIIKDGGVWKLVCYSLTGADNFQYEPPNNETIQLLGHTGDATASDASQVGPFLKWYSITTCETSIQ